MNKILTLLSLLSRMELNSETEAKKLETNYISTNYWIDNFLPSNNNFEIRLNGTEIV